MALMLAVVAIFAGCDPKNEDQTMQYVVTKGAIVLNAGDPARCIRGSITYIDFSHDEMEARQDVFLRANDMSLGNSLNDIMVYGDALYVTSGDEHEVYVIDPNNFRLIKRIDTCEEMGVGEGDCPRRLFGYDNKVYFSTKSGYVGVIDPESMSIEKQYKAGPSPEGVAVNSRGETPFLYVANSDDSYGDGSISIVNLSTGSTTQLKNDKIRYPIELAVAGDEIYVLDGGYFDENMNQQGAGIYLTTVDGSNVWKIAPDALGMAAVGYNILYYRKSEGGIYDYSVYNIVYSATSKFNFYGDQSSPIVEPRAVSIDPNTGYIFVASSPVSVDGDTSLPGYVNFYTGDGQFRQSFTVGVNPSRIIFLYELVEYK